MTKLQKFFKSDIAGGVLLALATVLALFVANSPLKELYHHFLETPIAVSVGSFAIDKHAIHWINDGLMAIFFFLVGLELKREIIIGELSEVKKIVLPAVSAVGGMLVPALIYAMFNYNNAQNLSGWAIPAATDIAFALGVVSLLGDKVPTSLRVFLASVAIFDDIGAILIIAFFYSHGINWFALGGAGVILTILFIMNRFNVTRIPLYAFLGIFLWVAVLKSGLHATIAGVLLAFCIPMYNHDKGEESESPVEELEHELHGFVAFIVLPIFAFANAGIYLLDSGIKDIFHPVPIAITAGLLLGKPIGIMIFSWLGVKSKLAELPKGVRWKHIFAVSILCGIGFTMSLFIGGLAFAGMEKAFDERLGIIIGSLLSGIIGYFVLKNATKNGTHLDLTGES